MKAPEPTIWIHPELPRSLDDSALRERLRALALQAPALRPENGPARHAIHLDSLAVASGGVRISVHHVIEFAGTDPLSDPPWRQERRGAIVLGPALVRVLHAEWTRAEGPG